MFLGIWGLPVSLGGMRRYAEHLHLCEESDPERRAALKKRYCRGWFLGSEKEKKSLIKELNEQHPNTDWSGSDLKELNEADWEALVKASLEVLGKGEESITNSPKGALWKAKIAKELRTQTTAGNPWIAQRLNMGHPSRVTNLIKGV